MPARCGCSHLEPRVSTALRPRSGTAAVRVTCAGSSRAELRARLSLPCAALPPRTRVEAGGLRRAGEWAASANLKSPSLGCEWVCVCVCDMHLASPIALLTSVLTIKVVKQFALQDGVKQQGVGEEMFV